jgi:hypothetical protein
VSVPLIDAMWESRALAATLPLDSAGFQFAVTWMLIGVVVALFGWVEDVAARGRPKLLP